MDTDDQKLLDRLQAKADQARLQLGEQQPRQMLVRSTKPWPLAPSSSSTASSPLALLAPYTPRGSRF